jgi:hypothetical protein
VKRASISLVVLFLSVLLIYVLLTLKKKAPDNLFCFRDVGTHHMPSYFNEINKNSSVGQSFVSNFDELFKISIFISKKNIEKDKELYFYLKSKKDSKDYIAFKKWKFSELLPKRSNFYQIPPDIISKKGFHFHVQIEPIRDSKGKEFYFYFESPETPQGKGIQLGVWNRKYYEALIKGKMFVNHKPVGGYLAFRTYNTWKGSFSEVIEVIVTRLEKDRFFFLVYILGIALIFSGIIVIKLKIKRMKKEEKYAS